MKPAVSPTLIGRAAEVDALRDLLGQAASGQGQIAVVSGEAGIGKTRLIAELRGLAQQSGFALLQGNCFEPDRTVPYAPLLDLMHGFLAAHSKDEIARDLGPFAPLLASLLPELRLILPDATLTPLLIPEREKNQLFYALEQFIFQLASRTLLLVILEDIHWSDDTSLDFLLHLARRLPTQPVLLLLTYRSEAEDASLTGFLVNLEREGKSHRLPLGPLGRAEVNALIRAMFDLDRPVTADFLDAIYTLTEGNPFFIEEVIKSLLAAGDIFYHRRGWDRRPLSQLRIPRSIHVAVEQRVEKLSEQAKQVVSLAAVAGRRFDFGLLQHLMGLDEESLIAIFRELLAAQIITEESADRYAFRHALTCRAVYDTLLARERKSRHRLIAETLERMHADMIDAYLSDLAYHYFEAGEWAKALAYGQRAGERAVRLYAPNEASEQFTRALEAAQHLGRRIPVHLLRARGKTYETIGSFERARADYEQALATAREFGDRQAEWQSLVDLGLLWASRDYTETGEYFQQALNLARDLNQPGLLAQSLNRCGNWLVNMERPLDAIHYHAEALALFEQLGDRQGQAESLDLLGLAAAEIGLGIDSYGYYERAVALFRELDDRRGLSSSLVVMGYLSANFLTDATVVAALTLPDGLRHELESLEIARQIEWRSGEAFSMAVVGCLYASMGRYTEALAHMRPALEMAEAIEHHQWTIVALVMLGALHAELLAFPAAAGYLERARSIANTIQSPYWIRNTASHLARVYAEQGDLARAETALAGAPGYDADFKTFAEKSVGAARLRLALARGDSDESLRIAQRLKDAVISPVTQPLKPWQRAPRLLLMYGQALTLAQRYVEAETHLREALSGAEAQEAVPLTWRIHRALGRLYHAQRRFEAAEDEFLTARAIVEALAAEIPDEALREEFLRQTEALLTIRSASPRRAAKRAWGGLTAREREIAALIGAGKSNREIADVLVLSERTVEKHSSNILNKLGFERRAQLINWIVEKGWQKNELR